MKLRIVSSLAALASVWAAGQTSMAPSWSHDPSSQIGPGYWGSVAPPYATCGTTTSAGQFQAVGAKQSPVDIEDATTLLAVLPGVRFNYDATPLEVENTGHVVEVPYETGSYVTIGRGVTDTYNFTTMSPASIPSTASTTTAKCTWSTPTAWAKPWSSACF
jgi:carbonic anhydrase